MSSTDVHRPPEALAHSKRPRTAWRWPLAVLFGGLLAALLPTARGGAQPPNVILVLTDDQGYADVGLHGNRHLQTPWMDGFAREGVEFTRFYSCPVCAPTRASLLTGRDFYRTGVIHTSRGGAKMASSEQTLAEMFRAAGYRTGIFGKWHLGDTFPMRPQDQGFDESLVHKSGGIGQTPDRPNSYFDPQLWHNGRRVQRTGYCTDVFFEAALEFLERKSDQPFFVYLPTNAPHTPLEISDEFVQPYRDAGLDDVTARVYGMIANLDQNFGRLLLRLQERQLREHTIVWFLGDNGPQQARYAAGLRGRKGSVYEGGIRVPSFLQYPAQIRGGRQLDQPTAHIDVVPTLRALCGLNSPPAAPLDGISLAGWLRADQPLPDRAIFLQCHRGLRPQRYQNCAIITDRFKLLGDPGTFSSEDLTITVPHWELYDLRADPGEQHELSNQHPQAVTRLSSAYEAWFESVRAARQFAPGTIVLGDDRDNPLTLCRYQDGTYRDGRPQGWSVRVARGAEYRLQVRLASAPNPGSIHVQWQGRHLEQSAEISRDGQRASATVPLEAGAGMIDVWFQETGRPRVVMTDNSTVGDVLVERLGARR